MDFVTELRRIRSEICRYQPPKHSRDFGFVHDIRALTQDEWRVVKRAIVSGLPASLGNGNFGFGIVLHVWAPRERLFPGTESETRPEHLIGVEAKQVPGKRRTRIDDRFGVFDLFMALVSTPENLALLAREGLDLPKSRGHYSY